MTIRCDYCGRFVPYRDLEVGRATRRLITPDSAYSREEYETACREHADTAERRGQVRSASMINPGAKEQHI